MDRLYLWFAGTLTANIRTWWLGWMLSRIWIWIQNGRRAHSWVICSKTVVTVFLITADLWDNTLIPHSALLQNQQTAVRALPSGTTEPLKTIKSAQRRLLLLFILRVSVFPFSWLQLHFHSWKQFLELKPAQTFNWNWLFPSNELPQCQM